MENRYDILDDGFGLKGNMYILWYEMLETDEEKINFLNELRSEDDEAFKVWLEFLKGSGNTIPSGFN